MARNASDWNRILRACGVLTAVAAQWSSVFADTIKDNTFSKGDKDLADWLPTMLHESAMLRRLKEDGNYSANRIIVLGQAAPAGSRWRSLVPIAQSLAYNEDKFFEAVYGGRMGNDRPGDGSRYRGRGLIMLTGKEGYEWQGDRSGQDLVALPELAEQPHFGTEFSIDWWEGKVPDRMLGDTRQIRKVVNGGYYGVAEVEALAKLARSAL